MMIEFDFWGWLILAVLLIAIEILAPASFFLWMGIAAAIVGGILFLLPALDWPIQIGMFAVLSVISVFIGRRIFRPSRQESDHPTLNQRGAQYIGRQFTLEAPIVNGVGWLHVGDSRWRALGADAPVGTVVRVVAVDSTNLVVQPVIEATEHPQEV
ncbi:MAG: NfeD family protein [Halothiobacillus sp.]|jgi:membrane protein implicated in regulation of membrane protease activity|nr:NfeD family protein [Halothiobacillus sp.]